MSIAHRLSAALLAVALAGTACTDSAEQANSADDPSGNSDNGSVTDISGDDTELTSALSTVGSCDALLDRLIAEGLEQVGPYGFGQQFNGMVMETMDEDAAADTAELAAGSTTSAEQSSRASAPAGAETDDVSGTNNQEVGVDEADLVKTDGNRMVVVSGNTVRVLDVGGDNPSLTQTVQLPDGFWGGELFLEGDTALLMSSGWSPMPLAREGSDSVFSDYGFNTGRIVEIDLVNGEVERTLEFEGSYLSAREVDGTIRVVVTATGERFNFLYPSNPGAEESAEEANRALVEESTLAQWIPSYRVVEGAPDADGNAGDVIDEGPMVSCDRMHLPGSFAGFGTLAVLTVDIDDGLSLNDTLGVFTDGQTVYASTDHLAVATPRWPEFDDEGQAIEDASYRTALHQFDISDPTTTSYMASGSVRGHLLDQYSISEHNDYLRVATTDGNNRWWGWRGDDTESESYVTVLAADGNDLVEVGQVDGLGIGEQIFAVRFMGDLGYVVTFEQIDPLYAIDLSDPANPKVLDELKIEGFSSYLHPLDDGKLLGIGTDGDETGRTFGAVASIFDISNPEDISRITKLSLGPNIPQSTGESSDVRTWVDASSSVSWQPKAFTLWKDRAIIPVSWWGYQEGTNSGNEANGAVAVVVEVNTEDGTLTAIGRIGHPARTECEGRKVPAETASVSVASGGLDAITTFEQLIEVSNGGMISAEEAALTETADDEDPDSADVDGDAEASFAAPTEDVDVIEPGFGPEEYCWRSQPEITRSVIIGDALYTVSESGVAVNDFDSLANQAWIPFN